MKISYTILGSKISVQIFYSTWYTSDGILFKNIIGPWGSSQIEVLTTCNPLHLVESMCTRWSHRRSQCTGWPAPASWSHRHNRSYMPRKMWRWNTYIKCNKDIVLSLFLKLTPLLSLTSHSHCHLTYISIIFF